MTTLSLITKPSLHNKFIGDEDEARKKIQKAGATELLNKLPIKLVNIKTNLLEPLESQRVTREKWTVERIIDLGGLDMWAFGALSVCYDKRDKKYYVWDGCGRLALAQLHGLEEVPCIVIEGKKEQAAFYFGYCQDSTQGRRTLSKEVLFVNRYYSGDYKAIKEAAILDKLGLYVKGDTNYSVPNPTPSGHIEIGYRAFYEGYFTVGRGDLALVRQARDMIATAWSHHPNGCRYINQDIFWAVIMLLYVYPEARKNGMNSALQKFLNFVATGSDQKNIKWKEKGLSGNSGVAGQLAYGLLSAWRSQDAFFRKNDVNVLTYKRLVDFGVDLKPQDAQTL